MVISREDVNGDDELIEHMAQHTRVLVVTESAAGSVLYWNGDRRRFRAPKVTEVDATGAGDVFNAGFLAAYLAGKLPQDCLQWGNIAGGLSLRGHGGYTASPTLEELLQHT